MGRVTPTRFRCHSANTETKNGGDNTRKSEDYKNMPVDDATTTEVPEAVEVVVPVCFTTSGELCTPRRHLLFRGLPLSDCVCI